MLDGCCRALAAPGNVESESVMYGFVFRGTKLSVRCVVVVCVVVIIVVVIVVVVSLFVHGVSPLLGLGFVVVCCQSLAHFCFRQVLYSRE